MCVFFKQKTAYDMRIRDWSSDVCSSDRALTLGEPAGGTSPRIERLAAALEAAGVKAPVADDIRAALWSKLFVNVSRSPLGVLTGLSERQLAEDAGTLGVTLAIMREAQAVARAHGLDVAFDEVRQTDPQKIGRAHV